MKKQSFQTAGFPAAKGKFPRRVMGIIFAAILMFPGVGNADIASVQAEITALTNQIDSLNQDQIKPKEAEIADIHAGMTEAREKMDAFISRNSWMKGELSTHKRNLRYYEGDIARLNLSYTDFFDAKKAWEQSSDPAVRKEKIMVLWTFLYGTRRQIDSWALNPNTQKDFVDMADLEVRKKAVARVGEALVLLGDLTVKFVSATVSVPYYFKEAVFDVIQFGTDTAIQIMPESLLRTINTYGGKYIPYLELQKAFAESARDKLNEIRNRDEFGGETGREEAIAQAEELAQKERDIIAVLEPEITEFETVKAQVEQNFANVQNDLMTKIQEELDPLKQELKEKTRKKIDKEFELKQLQAQEAISQSGGSVGNANSFSFGTDVASVAADPLTSSLLNKKQFAAITATADYVSTSARVCEYTVGENTYKESYKYFIGSYSSPLTNPVITMESADGGAARIEGFRVYSTQPGNVILRSTLSPICEGYRYVQGNCSQSYEPTGCSGQITREISLEIVKIPKALFLPTFYYDEVVKKGIPDSEKLNAMEIYSLQYGKASDLFVNGDIGFQRFIGDIYYQKGTSFYRYYGKTELKLEGDLNSFEIQPEIKPLGAGAITLTPIIYDSDGVQVQDDTQVPDDAPNTLTVTGNIIEGKADSDGKTGLTTTDEIPVVIGKPTDFKVVVNGPANMGNYRVNWRFQVYSYQYEDIDPAKYTGSLTTEFASGVSSNPVVFSKDLFKKKMIVKFEVIRKFDGKSVFQGFFDNIKTLARGKRFFLADKNTGAPYTGDRYFLFGSSSSIASKSLELRLDMENGEFLAVPLEYDIFTPEYKTLPTAIQSLIFGNNALENAGIGSISFFTDFMLLQLRTYNSGMAELGLYEIKPPDADTLLNEGIASEQTESASLALIEISLLIIDWREELPNEPVYVLKICSPSDLKDYTARWTFFDKTVETRPIVRNGIHQESTIAGNRILDKVELLNPSGLKVAEGSYYDDRQSIFSSETSAILSAESLYQYDSGKNRYVHILKKLALGGPKSFAGQYELTFEQTQNPHEFDADIFYSQTFPLLKNFSSNEKTLSFDIIVPEDGYYTSLTVLSQPKSGVLNVSGAGVAYSPNTGFTGKDSFIIRADEPICHVNSEPIRRQVSVMADCSVSPPALSVIRQVRTMYGYEFKMGFSDISGKRLTPKIVQPPAKAGITIDSTDSTLVKIVKNQLKYPQDSDQFMLGLTGTDASESAALVKIGYKGWYPKFFVYAGSDYPLKREFLVRNFFPNFKTVITLLKIKAYEGGTVLLNNIPVAENQEIVSEDFDKLVFRPTPGYTGPAGLYMNGSDGQTWLQDGYGVSGEVIAYGDVNGDGKIDLKDVIIMLKILTGIPAEQVILQIFDIDKDGKTGFAELLHLMKELMKGR